MKSKSAYMPNSSLQKIDGYGSSLFLYCGLVVYKLGLVYVKAASLLHILFVKTRAVVVKVGLYTQVLAQSESLFYTVFKQAKKHFSSVERWVVHIIHIAYKKSDYLEKGTI